MRPPSPGGQAPGDPGLGVSLLRASMLEKMEEERGAEPYPWHLLLPTALLALMYLALGVNDALGGPTLLDLRWLVL